MRVEDHPYREFERAGWACAASCYADSFETITRLFAKALLDAVGARPGSKLLDVACGSGLIAAAAAAVGAHAEGVDFSPDMVDAAKKRFPQLAFRQADAEALPFADDTFDLVTGFNAFFFANDMVAALREAGRVAKPGARVVIQVWGDHENCDLEAMKLAARPFFPPRPAGAPADPDFSQPGILPALATEAGLVPEQEFTATWTSEYPDAETLGRAMIAVAGLVVLAGPEREEELRTVIVDGLAPFRTPDGGYRFSNEYRYLVASA